MTKLEWLLGRNEDIRHPHDVARLKREIPEISQLPDMLVQQLYSDWSEDHYAAGWMMGPLVAEFAGYLREELPPAPIGWEVGI